MFRSWKFSLSILILLSAEERNECPGSLSEAVARKTDARLIASLRKKMFYTKIPFGQFDFQSLWTWVHFTSASRMIKPRSSPYILATTRIGRASKKLIERYMKQHKNRMKKSFDKHACQKNFDPGDDGPTLARLGDKGQHSFFYSNSWLWLRRRA